MLRKVVVILLPALCRNMRRVLTVRTSSVLNNVTIMRDQAALCGGFVNNEEQADSVAHVRHTLLSAQCSRTRRPAITVLEFNTGGER